MGEHRVPGGGFPLPLAAAELCQRLPPPESFNGPFVIVDRLIEVFSKMFLPDEMPGKMADRGRIAVMSVLLVVRLIKSASILASVHLSFAVACALSSGSQTLLKNGIIYDLRNFVCLMNSF